LLPENRGDVAVDGDGEPEELADPAPGWVWLGDAELEAELADGEPEVELADGELAVGDPEVAGDVTVNCSTAMGALMAALTRVAV
jgi:hypothetical protein